MKVSKKRLREIDLALHDAVRETMERYIHDISQRPPDDWNDHERVAFDAITDTQYALEKGLKKLFTAGSGRDKET